MHVQVVVNPAEQPSDEVRNVQYSAAEDPVQGTSGMRAAAQAAIADGSLDAEEVGPVATSEAPTMQPVVKSDWDKTPRNAPCPCGSGKKFKLCHGR
jgi:preprotein translocase subunit SecA